MYQYKLNMNTIVVQKIRSVSTSNYELAEKYYNTLAIVNNLKLTQREIQLIAFTAIHGNLSDGIIREEFCKKYDTTSATISNIVSKLKKLNIIIKNEGEIKINPVIVINFDLDVLLEIKLVHEDQGTID